MKKYVYDSLDQSVRMERALYEFAKDIDNSLVILSNNDSIAKFKENNMFELNEKASTINRNITTYHDFFDRVTFGDLKSIDRLIFPDYLELSIMCRRSLYRTSLKLGVKELYMMTNFLKFTNVMRENARDQLLLVNRVRKLKSVSTNYDVKDVNELINGLNATLEDVHNYLYNVVTDSDVIILNM